MTLWLASLALLAAAPPPAADAAILRDAFAECLRDPAAPPPPGEGWTRRTLPAAGRPVPVDALALPVGRGEAFVYRTVGGSEVGCGVVLYRAPGEAAFRTLDEAARGVGWSPTRNYTPGDTPPARLKVYGDGLVHVLVLVRREAAPDVPTVQAERHDILLH